VSAEGQEDFVFRIRAWMENARVEQSRIPFFLIPTAIDLRSDQEGAKKLAAEINAVSKICQEQFGVAVGVTVLDTVNRALAGGNENASEVMGAFVGNCALIKDQTNSAVLGVHHSPESKEGAGKARGHGSLHGATDAEIVVLPPHSRGEPNVWKVTRQKAGPTGARHEFKLRQHVLGTDEDGDEVNSCVVMSMGFEPSMEGAESRDVDLAAKTGQPHMTPDGRVILRDNLTLIMKALQAAIDTNGGAPPVTVRAPHGRKVVTMTNWLDEMVRIMPGDNKKDPKFRDKCRKARDAAAAKLSRREIIGMDDDYVWRTSRLVASVDRAPRSDSGQQNSETPAENSETGAASSEEALNTDMGFLDQ
jgi:hypothetical protein